MLFTAHYSKLSFVLYSTTLRYYNQPHCQIYNLFIILWTVCMEVIIPINVKDYRRLIEEQYGEHTLTINLSNVFKCNSQSLNTWNVSHFILKRWLYYLQSLMCSNVSYYDATLHTPWGGKEDGFIEYRWDFQISDHLSELTDHGLSLSHNYWILLHHPLAPPWTNILRAK